MTYDKIISEAGENAISHKTFYKYVMNASYQNYNGSGFTFTKSRLFFILNCYKNRHHLEAFLQRFSKLTQSKGIKLRPEMFGVADWPYIHNKWDVAFRLSKLITHYELLQKLESTLIYVTGNATGDGLNCSEVMDLGDISPNLKIVIDKAPWFVREGELLINIMRGDLRVASIAFTLGEDDKEKVVYIGAIQGIYGGFPAEEALEIYKTLTKDFEGLRPRSLLLEILKSLVSTFGVSRVYGISDQNRHHRHKYFRNNENTVFKNDYNAIWEEHSGVLNATTGFYELPVSASIRPIEDIASKKRALYKRRYEIMESFKDRLQLTNSA